MTSTSTNLAFAYTVLFVPDVQDAVDFYGRAFGLKPRMVDPRFAQMEIGAVALAFGLEASERHELPDDFAFNANRADAAAAGFQISFTSTDVQVAFDHAVAAGCTPVIAPRIQPWGQTVSRVRDLNGVLVSLVSPFRPA